MIRTAAVVILILGFVLPTDDAAAQFGYHFGRNKIQYEDFDWQVMKTDHFDIYYYDEERAAAAMVGL